VRIALVDLGKLSDRPSILPLAILIHALVALLKVFLPQQSNIGVGRGMCRWAFHMQNDTAEKMVLLINNVDLPLSKARWMLGRER
jgi:hypothetical protein